MSSAEKAAKLADSLGYFTLMVIHYNGFKMVYKFSEIIGIQWTIIDRVFPNVILINYNGKFSEH